MCPCVDFKFKKNYKMLKCNCICICDINRLDYLDIDTISYLYTVVLSLKGHTYYGATSIPSQRRLEFLLLQRTITKTLEELLQ